MAWRDSRPSRGRLLLFSLTIMAGLAALVIMGSLRDGLLEAMEREARGMLGADAMVQSQRAFSEKAETLLSEKSLRVLQEDCLSGMVSAPAAGTSRLIQLRGLEPGFPLYGTVTTDPPDAWSRCLSGEGCVAGPDLAEVLKVQPGDRLKIGDIELPLLGILVRPPPQVNLLGALAPELFTSLTNSAASGWRGGIRLQAYRRWITYPEGFSTASHWNGKRKRELRAEGGRVETLDQRREQARRVLEIVHTFLSLVAFTSLVLGGLGVAGSMHVHATERLPAVATLRCLGAGASQAMSVFILQGLWLAAAGAAGGVIMGALLLPLVPVILQHWAPFVEVTAPLSWKHAGMAAGFGFLLCLCFSILPLLRVRRVPAMAAVRETALPRSGAWRDSWRWALLLLAGGALYALARQLSPPDIPAFGPALAAALGVALLLLTGTGGLLMWLLRRTMRPWWPFTMRQGIASLFRPGNQTLLYILSGGLGVLLITLTLLLQQLLTGYMDRTLRIPVNFGVMELNPDKMTAVSALLQSGGATSIISAQAIPLTIASVRGKDKMALLEEAEDGKDRQGVSGWALGNTWRGSVWMDAPPATPGEPFPVSMDDSLRSQLRLTQGDPVSFQCGTRTISCRFVEAHKPSWEQMLRSFPILLPAAALEGLTGSGIIVARTADAAMGARLQRAVVQAAPTAAVIDLATLTAILDRILNAAGWAVRALSLAVALAGFLVLIAVLAAGRRDRMRESLLLRTLGADRSTIRRILLWEYLLMGLTAAVAGAALAILATWLLCQYQLRIPFHINPWPIATAILLMALISTLLGWLLSRGILQRPPASILR